MSNSIQRIMVTSLAVATVVGLAAGGAWGQTVQVGKITGTVVGPDDEAVAGAGLVLRSEALVSGQRETSSAADGDFVFLNLPSGDYDLTVTLEGFKTYSQEGIVVPAGATITVDVVMEMGVVEDVVTVTATSPVLDVKTSAVATRFDDELLEKMPTGRDAFYDLALTAPGMNDVGANADIGWLVSPSAYGGAQNENVFLINGVNTTNPRGGFQGSLVAVNYSTVEEVRVLSLGTQAEYGSFSGVAIDVLTKSGGNAFHGELGYYKMLDSDENQPSGNTGFGADWLHANPDDELMLIPDDQQELNFTLGGPLMKNKLWFFVGYADNSADTKEPYFPLLREYRADLYDVKLTAEPNPKHLAWLAYHFEDQSSGNNSWGRQNWDPTMIYTENSESDSLSAQWQWIASSRTFLSVKYLGFETDNAPTIPADGPSNPGYVNWWKWGRYAVAGAHPWVEGMDSHRDTYQADVSHYAEDFLGQHDMKFGVQYTDGASNWAGGYFHGYANFAYPEPWTQNVAYLQSWYGDTGLRIYVNQDHLNPFLTVRETDSQGAFFDDQWVVNDRLTLNLGLRYDKMTAGYGVGKVYEQPATPAQINDPPPVIRDRQSTGDVFEFTTWSPRIGATYQLTKDGKTVLRASYGRFYAPITTENLRRFGPDMPLTHRFVLHYSVPFAISDADGDGFIDSQNLMDAVRALPGLDPVWVDDQGLRDDSWQLQVDPGLDDTYTDQFTLSLAREVFPNFAVEATYIYKKTGDILVNWPINRETQEDWIWDRVSYTAPRSGNTFNVYTIRLLDYNGDGVVDSADAVWVTENIDYRVRNLGTVDDIPGERTYHGFQLAFQKRYSNRWQAMGSFLYSDSDGVAPRTSHQDWYIDGPMIMDTAFVGSPNNLVNNMEGQLPMTPKYSLKLAGNYTIPKLEVDLGFRFRYNKGRPFSLIEVVPQYASWMGDVPPNVILSTGGEGGGAFISADADLLPAQKILDLSLGREFSLGKGMSLGVTLDVLNVFNDDTVNDAGYHDYDYGQVLSLISPRLYRLGVRFRI